MQPFPPVLKMDLFELCGGGGVPAVTFLKQLRAQNRVSNRKRFHGPREAAFTLGATRAALRPNCTRRLAWSRTQRHDVGRNVPVPLHEHLQAP